MVLVVKYTKWCVVLNIDRGEKLIYQSVRMAKANRMVYWFGNRRSGGARYGGISVFCGEVEVLLL